MKNEKIEKMAISILTPQALCMFAELFCEDAKLKYESMSRPFFYMKYETLGILTTILYGMFGLSFYYIYSSKHIYEIERQTACYCSFIGFSLLSNIFFYFVDIIIIKVGLDIIMVIYGVNCAKSFAKINKKSAMLFLATFLPFIYYIILKECMYCLN